MTTTTVQATPGTRERVAAGVGWLDANDPGWWREDAERPIDLDELRMADPCRCVLGQRNGDYYNVEIALDEAVACGFDTATGAAAFGDPSTAADIWARVNAEFDELTAEWSRVITERRMRAVACCPCTGVICDAWCVCPECPKSEAELTDECD